MARLLVTLTHNIPDFWTMPLLQQTFCVKYEYNKIMIMINDALLLSKASP